jgi:putative Ca2+/H+ antiporter (TMEM165/GDT1 family)
MNFEKVIFAFFIILALTLNFGFFIGDPENVTHHHIYELYAALVVSIIATILKFGDRSQLGAVVLASSLVSDLQLILAAVIWMVSTNNGATISSETMVTIVSLSGGALVANLISVILLITETSLTKR